MSQILLPPPSSQPGSDQTVTPALATPPAPPTPTPAPGPRYEPEPPKRPSAFWRVLKWPLRKLFKLVYLVGSAARRHRLATVLTLVFLAALGGTGYGLYYYTHPTRAFVPFSSGQTAQTPASGSNVPFTIISQQPPTLPTSVIHWLHGHKVFDAHEMWNSLSPQAQANLEQQNITEQALQTQLDQEKAAGLAYDEYIYTGGFAPPGGDANFTVQVIVTQNGQSTVRTWYFVVDPNGQLIVPLDINTLFGQ